MLWAERLSAGLASEGFGTMAASIFQLSITLGLALAGFSPDTAGVAAFFQLAEQFYC